MSRMLKGQTWVNSLEKRKKGHRGENNPVPASLGWSALYYFTCGASKSTLGLGPPPWSSPKFGRLVLLLAVPYVSLQD